MKILQQIGPKGSLKWIQVLVNEHGIIFDREISADLKLNFDKISWLSPLVKDDCCQYRHEDLLKVLGLSRCSDKLKTIRPKSGLQWDALGRAAGCGSRAGTKKGRASCEALPVRLRSIYCLQF